MSKAKINSLYIEIDALEKSDDKFEAYKNIQGQYVIHYVGEIVDFHFHFGPGPDSIDQPEII